MKAEDVIKALTARLPFLTDRFSAQKAIDTITSSGTTATATVAAGHGLETGGLITITGAISPIAVVSITRVDDKATVITSTNHDFTLGINEAAHGFAQDVIISGANEAEFNGTFALSSVTNRKEFIIDIADAGPASSTGTVILENGSSEFAQYNGAANVTVLNAAQFTYELLEAIPGAAIGSPVLNSGIRVTGAVTIERFLDAYTPQNAEDLWAVVVLGDVVASKGRENRSDSTDEFSDNQHYQQTITQPFGVYIITQAVNSIAGRTQRDDMETIIPLVMKSVLLNKFPTGFTANKEKRATFNAHGIFLYNKAQYVHEITFEQNADLIFEDTVGSDVNVAFRDIELTIGTDLGDTTLNADIDLDETPLP